MAAGYSNICLHSLYTKKLTFWLLGLYLKDGKVGFIGARGVFGRKVAVDKGIRKY